MNVFIRKIENGEDKILLKAMPMLEYLAKVNNYILAKKNYVEKLNKLYNFYDSDYCKESEKVKGEQKEIIRSTICREMTFEYYPVPCENYKSNNRWIDTKNLERYKIK